MIFLLRRLAHAMFLLIGTSMLSFLLLQLAPGDFFQEMRLNPQISPETVAGLRTRFGLDQSLPVRYGHWLQSVSQGDFGYSFAYDSAVAPLLFSRARNTLVLAISATVLAWIMALAIGVWSATRTGHWEEQLCTGAMAVLAAMPDILIALLLLLLAVKTGILPSGGMVSASFDNLSAGKKLLDVISHLALPLLALIAGLLPTLIRHVRSSVSSALGATSVQAMRGHGIRPGRLLMRHVLPLAANPLISLFGISVATLLSVSLLIEIITSWPGLGPFFLEAILARDVYVVIGTVLLSTLFMAGGNLFADALLCLVDPRIRRK